MTGFEPIAIVGRAVERPAVPGGAQTAQGRETERDDQPVAAADRASEHKVRRTVMQPVAGDLHRVQGGGAGRFHRCRSRTETQCPGRRVRRQPGAEPRSSVHTGHMRQRGEQVGVVGQPDPLGVRRQAPAGESQVPQNQAGSRE